MPSKEESQGWVLIFGAAQPPLSLVTTLTGDSHVSLPVLEVMRDEALPVGLGLPACCRPVRKGGLKY